MITFDRPKPAPVDWVRDWNALDGENMRWDWGMGESEFRRKAIVLAHGGRVDLQHKNSISCIAISQHIAIIMRRDARTVRPQLPNPA